MIEGSRDYQEIWHKMMNLNSDYTRRSEYGGLMFPAIWYDAGAVTPLAGECVHIVQGRTVDFEVERCPVSENGPIGFIHPDSAGTAVGDIVWVVYLGIAQMIADPAGAGIARSDILVTSAATAGTITGNAVVPAAAIHFRETGHALTAAAAGSLFLGIIHFN